MNVYNWNFGEALRCYNTGSVPNPQDLSQVVSGSTPSYVSDMANRVMGVTGTFDEASCGFAAAA